MPRIVKQEIELEFQAQVGPYSRARFLVGGFPVADLTTLDPRSKEVQKLLAKLRESGVKITADVGGVVP